MTKNINLLRKSILDDKNHLKKAIIDVRRDQTERVTSTNGFMDQDEAAFNKAINDQLTCLEKYFDLLDDNEAFKKKTLDQYYAGSDPEEVTTSVLSFFNEIGGLAKNQLSTDDDYVTFQGKRIVNLSVYQIAELLMDYDIFVKQKKKVTYPLMTISNL